MAFQQTFDTSTLNLSGLMDRSAEMGAKAREIGGEMINLSVRNFETASRAGRELLGARDLSEAARIQMGYLTDLVSAFTDHAGRVAEIAMQAGKQAGADTAAAANRAADAANQATHTVLGEAGKAVDKGFEAARKIGV